MNTTHTCHNTNAPSIAREGCDHPLRASDPACTNCRHREDEVPLPAQSNELMRDFVLAVLGNKLIGARDNLARVMMAFKRCTPQEMQQEYGESGKTRAQLSDECEADVQTILDAIEWVRTLGNARQKG